MLAENVRRARDRPRFSDLAGFRKELGKGYSHVGISFIMTNFDKARKMAEVVRELAPDAKIILGGMERISTGIEGMNRA